MENNKQIYDFFVRICPRTTHLIYFLLHYKMFIEERSFYPEKEHKSKFQIFKEFVRYILKNGDIDYTYFVLGLDVKGTNYRDYISYHQFMVRRDRLNMIRRDRQDNAEPANYSCILRDKSLFSIYANYWKFPVVKDLAKIMNSRMTESDYESMEDLLKANPHVFIKPIDGQKGEDVYGVDIIEDKLYLNGRNSSMSEFKSIISKVSEDHSVLFQRKVIQHPVIMALHERSVNTLRVVTINHLHSTDLEDVILVGSELRVGCGGNHTDNVSAGGIKIGVNNDGTLFEYGFYDKKHGTKTASHPDTGIVFKGYLIPFYKESVQLCKEFHAKLKEIHIIGWDIAITEEGPILIEGNESCGTDFQVMFGPMRKFYDEYLPYCDADDEFVYKS